MGTFLTVINPAKYLLPKLDDNRAKICHFLGYDNHVKTRYYWSPENHMILVKLPNVLLMT